MHLHDSGAAIWEELQALLAGHDIKGLVGHRQRSRRRHHVFESRPAWNGRLAGRDRNHRRTDVGTDHAAS
jgi:hypothetical protein